MPIRFDQPAYLWLLLLAVPVAWLGWRYLRALSPGRRRLAVVIRVMALLLIVLALAGLETVKRHHELAVVAVVDESQSMQRFAPLSPIAEAGDAESVHTWQDWTRQWLHRAALGRRPDDRLGLVTYDARPTVQVMPVAWPFPDGGVVAQPLPGSRGGAAVRLAMAMLPPDTARRIILVSDGNDTAQDDLLAAARQAAGAGVPIDVLPVDYQLDREVMVEAVHVPAQARQGQTVALRIVLRATRPTEGLLHLFRNGMPVDLNGESPGQAAPVTLTQWTPAPEHDPAGRYMLVKVVQWPMADPGAHRFEAVFEPLAGTDAVAANNRGTALTLVSGQGRVLVLSNEPLQETKRLTDMLAAHDIQTEVGAAPSLPDDLAALSSYDAVVMQNIPAELVSESQQVALSQYVTDLGGGLIVIGGPDSYGAGGWTHSTLSRIWPVDCELPAQLVLPTGALVIVMDRSGSMAAPVDGSSYTQQEVAAEAAVMAIATLYPRDLVGVVAFDDRASWVTPLDFNEDRLSVMKQVRAISPDGGTHIYSGLEMAYRALAEVEAQQAAVKHIILLTDGQSYGGDYPDLLDRMRRRNITLSTIGVGDGVNHELLDTLARQGRGVYYPVNDPRRLPQVFIKEARAIRRNLILEAAFTPRPTSSGSPVLMGMTQFPPLAGLVRTHRRADPRVFTAMVGPQDDPLLAHWQVGLGQVAAFTSDATSRWAENWLAWPGYGDFWSRLVRTIGRPGSSRDLELTTRFEDQTLHLRLEAAASGSASAEGGFSQLTQVRGVVVGPDGRREVVTLDQTGPGLYETKLDAAAEGSYLVTILGQDDRGRRQAVTGGANRPLGMELRRVTTDRRILEEVAAITGGRVLTATADEVTSLFAREGHIEASRSIRPRWRTLVWLLLPLFLLDVASRRLTWDPAALRAWLGLRDERRQGRSGAAGGVPLAMLRRKVAGRASSQTREAVQVASARASAGPSPSVSTSGRQSTSASARASGSSVIPTGQVDQALKKNVGQTDKETSEGTSEGTSGAGDTSGGGTQRLLDAKRRARERMEGQ